MKERLFCEILPKKLIFSNISLLFKKKENLNKRKTFNMKNDYFHKRLAIFWGSFTSFLIKKQK